MNKTTSGGALSHRGKLKIFFGYAAGTGKTWAMLDAGQSAQKKGVDVVIGYLEPHDRPETMNKAKGLETVSTRTIEYKGIEQKEMDLDAILHRAPQLVLVDELAHTNAKGSRHAKRYKDIRELLVHGIDVYTTLNVQHLESLHDKVASITGILVQERIPDDVFDLADQIELIDLEISDLLERLHEGKIYAKEQARLASENFFTFDHLMALREIALRRCASRLALKKSVPDVQEQVLVCLSPSPSNARIIRSASEMARAFDANFLALYIQGPEHLEMSDEDKARLQENIRLADRLGASVESVYGEDIAKEIGSFANSMRVSKIVIGRQGRKSAFGRRSFAEKLAASAPQAQIFILPDPDVSPSYSLTRSNKGHTNPFLDGIGLLLGVLVCAVAIAIVLEAFGFSQANLLAIFILADFLCALFARHWLQALFSWGLCVFIFGYRFAHPVSSLIMFDRGYLVVFGVMLILSLLVSKLSIRLRAQASISEEAALQNALLYQASQKLQSLVTRSAIESYLVQEIGDFMDRPVVLYPNAQDSLAKPVFSKDPDPFLNTKEQAVALWTLKNNRRAGAGTDTLSGARGLYLAIRREKKIFGVLGIDMNKSLLSPNQNIVLLSLLNQAALAFENIEIAKEKEEAAWLAHQQQLKASLLRSISHDLRTPLTTIKASADLLSCCELSQVQQSRLAKSISEEASWLKDTVENLLLLSRLDHDEVRLDKEMVDLDEVVHQALAHVNLNVKKHPLQIEIGPDCVGFLDGRLMVQVMMNLINNAILHTPEGTPIQIQGMKKEERVVVDVIDEGPGIDDKQRVCLFEPFAQKSSVFADGSRSMSLGLSLVKSIVEAHHGTITCLNRDPGTCFHIELPAVGEEYETSDFKY